MSLDAISTTDPFDTFTKTLCVGYDNVTLTLHSMVGRLGRVVAPIINLSGRPVTSFLHFVQGPFGVVAFSESFPEVLFFWISPTVHLSSEGDSFLNSQANNNISNNNIANITINSVNSQTNSQGLSPIHTPAIAHPPLGEGSNSLPGTVHLPPEGDSSPQSTSSTPAREENNSSQAIPPPVTSNPQSSSSPQSGQGNNPPRAGRQGTRHPPRQQPIQPSQEACATSREGNPTSTPPQQFQPRFFQ